MDGVDVALIETDGDAVVRQGPVGSRPYAPAERDLLRQALVAAKPLAERDVRPDVLREAERMVTAAHAEAVEAFLAQNGLSPVDLDVVGFHGQTVLHRPERRLTVQIGDGSALAARLGIDVVYDFRAADVAAGGQGAPFVPVYHRALAIASELALPVVVLNLGGVANVTWVGEGDPVAFDTGPASAMIDDWVSAKAGLAYDDGGAIAARGEMDEAALARLLDHPYFSAPPPKSLDRNDFDPAPVAHLSLEDGAATLAAFTAATVALAGDHFPEPAAAWVASGGGARNGFLLKSIAEKIAAPLQVADEIGWSSSHMEAQAFAYLAVRSLEGLPLSFPTTTGVDRPTTGGVFAAGKLASPQASTSASASARRLST